MAGEARNRKKKKCIRGGEAPGGNAPCPGDLETSRGKRDAAEEVRKGVKKYGENKGLDHPSMRDGNEKKNLKKLSRENSPCRQKKGRTNLLLGCRTDATTH